MFFAHASARALCVVAMLASVGACAHGPATSDVTPAGSDASDAAISSDASDAAISSDAVQRPTDAGPFEVAPHPALLQIPDQGGPIIAHPGVVIITYANDPNRAALEAFDRWLIGSSWLATVGAEYGVGSATLLATIELDRDAPTEAQTVDASDEVSLGWYNGTIPRSTAADFSDTIYIVHFPSTTHITDIRSVTSSCTVWGGIHSAQPAFNGDPGFAFAAIPMCPPDGSSLTPLQNAEIATAHELIEAMTDPRPYDSPAYSLTESSDTSWRYIGGEVADLCSLSESAIVAEDGYVLPTVWSNAAALRGDVDPCVPATHPYFSVAPTPAAPQSVAAGASVTIDLAAWSAAPVADFTLRAVATGAFTPTLTLDRSTANNGDHAHLTIRVPASASSGDMSMVYVVATHGLQDYHVTPIAVLVP